MLLDQFAQRLRSNKEQNGRFYLSRLKIDAEKKVKSIFVSCYLHLNHSIELLWSSTACPEKGPYSFHSRVSINTAVTLSFGQKARVKALLHLICICPKVISLCPFHPVCFPLRKQTAVFVRNECLHWTAEHFGAITLSRQRCCHELLPIAHYGDLPTFFFHFI